MMLGQTQRNAQSQCGTPHLQRPGKQHQPRLAHELLQFHRKLVITFHEEIGISLRQVSEDFVNGLLVHAAHPFLYIYKFRMRLHFHSLFWAADRFFTDPMLS